MKSWNYFREKSNFDLYFWKDGYFMEIIEFILLS